MDLWKRYVALLTIGLKEVVYIVEVEGLVSRIVACKWTDSMRGS
jgi:hypothetical protein